MKNRLIITLIALSVSLSGMAATCPPAEGLKLNQPPAGWSLLLPPIIAAKTYHFGRAIHSATGSFYYQHVICVYEDCASPGCSSFGLLSNSTFQYPESNAKPWDTQPRLKYTEVCEPSNHDPSVCIFQ